MAGEIRVEGELVLMALLEAAVREYCAENEIDDETADEVSRAVAWLASKYGD